MFIANLNFIVYFHSNWSIHMWNTQYWNKLTQTHTLPLPVCLTTANHRYVWSLVIWRRNRKRFQGTGSKVPEPVPKPGTCGTVFSERELTFTFAIWRRPSVCLSVVCNVGAPYSGDWNFRQCFYTTWYLGHLWPFGKNITEIVPGKPLRRGVKPRGVEKCSDFGPFQGYISLLGLNGERKIGGKLLLMTNRKSHFMSFRLVPNLVTLNDLERRNRPNGCIISPNSVAFWADCVKVVEDTRILSVAEM